MTIYMSDILCITNRKLCREDFLTRIEEIAKAKPAGIVLREKDLSETDYLTLAKDVLKICRQYDTPCILHSFVQTAIALKADAIHLPLPLFLQLGEKEKKQFSVIGVSCHSLEDALIAEKNGCTYITAGHIFETDCKKGLPGRGLTFLRQICQSTSVPVYAIGGINPKNITKVRQCGVKGACIMSGTMVCEDVKKYLENLT